MPQTIRSAVFSLPFGWIVWANQCQNSFDKREYHGYCNTLSPIADRGHFPLHEAENYNAQPLSYRITHVINPATPCYQLPHSQRPTIALNAASENWMRDEL